MGYCIVCNMPSTDAHHVFPGSRRKKSTQYGFVVNLCRAHHNEIHMHPNKGLDLALKQKCQEDFEKTHSREEFIKEFGRSYL